MNIIRYFSMFSGIGGFELGIQRAATELGTGAECVGYSEIDKHAIRTYEEHFNHDNYGDATTINPDALPGFDLLVGGFPCQAFSIAGRRRGFEETRGTLFFDIARVLRIREPRHFILENVKGLINHKGGATFRTILRTLDELGYDVQWKVLNSKDYGVPQHRERVYLVGNLGGTPRPEVFSPTGPGNPYSTIGKSTETAVARTLTAGGHSGGNHSGMTILELTGARSQSQRLYDPAGLSPTLSTGGAATGGAEVPKINIPPLIRRLTPTEFERLQGFPDGWTLGSDTQRYKQGGNAVTVPVAQYVASRVLISHLKGNKS
jgi:DNA (cytosine-5)-methyltransferase 1